MKNITKPTSNPQEPLAMIQARLIFIAPLPDGQQALGFVDSDGRAFLTVVQAGAVQSPETT